MELAAMAGTSAGGAAQLLGAVAQAVGVREEPGRSLQVTLAERLRDKALLLDSCEHLVEPCAELADRLLRECAQLRILATSREELRVPGEQFYQVPPLSLPATPDGPLARASTPRHLRASFSSARSTRLEMQDPPEHTRNYSAT